MTEVIDDLVSQYHEETAFLWSSRNRVVRAANYGLSDLAEFDERIAASIEGLHVSGTSGWHYCEKGLESGEPGEAFAAAVIALETCDADRIEKVLDAGDNAPESIPGISSAFGWVKPTALRTIVARLFQSPKPSRRQIAVAACAMHRVDPGLLSAHRLEDPSPRVKARALRAAGELGYLKALPECMAAVSDKDPECRLRAACSAVLLGDRNTALSGLRQMVHEDPGRDTQAFPLALQALEGSAHGWLQTLAADPKNMRWILQGSGIVGDPAYLPWLIQQMNVKEASRLAADAFSLITGVDCRTGGLGGERPADFDSGPNDDPDDPNVAVDPDENLPWPNVEKIKQWYAENKGHFQNDMRYFMGALVTPEHCVGVLNNGYQHQRILAAHYLCLLNPGTSLFDTSAPAFRQQRLLAGMG
jgi:uncharacterized protein (TIGR02270 family)